MLRIEPTTPADVKAFYPAPPPYRIKAYTGFWHDRVIAIGGLGFPPGEPVVAFCDLTEEAFRHPVSLHKFARRVMNEARASGIRRITATMDTSLPSAPRWLARLGFTPLPSTDNTVWTWQA